MRTKLLLILAALLLLNACASAPATPAATEATETSDPSAQKQQTAEPNTEDTAAPTNSSTEAATEPSAPSDETDAPTQQPTNAETTAPPATQGATTPPATQPTTPPHTHNYAETVIAATCTAEGYTKHTCACGTSYTDRTTPALGHDYAETVVPATASAEGYTLHTCSRCADSYRDSYTPLIQRSDADLEAMAIRICAEVNAYIPTVGCTVWPEALSWAAPRDLSWDAVDSGYGEAYIISRMKEAVLWKRDEQNKSHMYCCYEKAREGQYLIYLKYAPEYSYVTP